RRMGPCLGPPSESRPWRLPRPVGSTGLCPPRARDLSRNSAQRHRTGCTPAPRFRMLAPCPRQLPHRRRPVGQGASHPGQIQRWDCIDPPEIPQLTGGNAPVLETAATNAPTCVLPGPRREAVSSARLPCPDVEPCLLQYLPLGQRHDTCYRLV